jgi:hypothetical protein
MRRFRVLALFAGLAALWFLAVGATFVTTVSFPDFSDLSDLTLNGSAAGASTVDGNVLRLTPNSGNQAGSAYLTQTIPLPPGSSFASSFCFRIGPAAGADGLAFVVQSQGATALGNPGGGIGYQNVSPSVAVQFDTYPDALPEDHLGIDVNGALDTGASVAAGFDLDSNTLLCAWVDYLASGTLEVRIANSTTRPAAATLSTALDVPATVGANAFFGFSAGTGGEIDAHDIVNWTLQVNTVQIPTLGTTALVLFGLALAGLAIVVLRR